MARERYRWTDKDEDDLETFYWQEIAVEMRADGLDPATETPPYQWLVEHGYSGFIDYLKREFDATPGEFYENCDLPPEATDGYWGLGHDPTRTALESYVEELGRRRDHPETTVAPIRSRLKKYASLYADVNETDDLLSALLREDERPEEIDRALAVFDVLDRALGTTASKFKYLEDTRRWYRWLVDVGRAAYNPLDRMEKRFGWNRPEWDNPALSRADVRSLSRTAETPDERFLVVGLAGWGLRPSELCSLRADQLVLAPEDGVPYVEFEEGERKNGPGTVSLLVGLDALEARLDRFDADSSDGYLLPSSTSASGHLTTDTARRQFAGLAERANVTVAGETPTPKHGRRFWYSLYGDAVREVAERFADVAEEQGSASARVVLDNYLSEAERRKHRREAMRAELRAAFET